MPTFVVNPKVVAIAQDTDLSCWAAALAMVNNWKYPIPPKSAHEMAQAGGQEFLDYYLNGLPHSSDATLDKFGKLIKTYTLGALPPQTYSLDQWKQLLMAHGPLAILVDAPPDGDHYTHILVLHGIEWQSGFVDAIFHIVDPDGGAVVPAAASVVQQRLDANDVVQLSTIKGWYSL